MRTRQPATATNAGGFAVALPSVSSHDWTIDKLHALPDDGKRYEIIDGMLYVTPSPGVPHQRALIELVRYVWAYAYAAGLMPMLSPADIIFSERTVLRPDLFVFAELPGAPVRAWSDIPTLRLAVEVLSPGTARVDRAVKRTTFQEHGVWEYWIIDARARVIERRRPDSTEAEKLTTSLSLQPVATHPPLHIDLA
jgi:Uma2 family endonuclease